tara:strand:- start:576 stop:1658 length:1083 start_codon:yes stop_codon:yes gene_type:complete
MSAPRLEIDLEKIYRNARTLVDRLAPRGISVTGVTKAALGLPSIANELLRAGVSSLGDSRVVNLETLRRASVSATIKLIRSPMLSEVARVVQYADVSFNTEMDVIYQLSVAAQAAGIVHGVVLMVELGDLREGILPADLEHAVRQTLLQPNISLAGIGTNLACRSGVVPDANNMGELSRLADEVDAEFDVVLGTVSGGNSANLQWALSGADTGRINDLRLGEAILLGRDPLDRQPIDGLHLDAFTLIAEVIESKAKPSVPNGEIGQSAFGHTPRAIDRGLVRQMILAVGRQDCDPAGLTSSTDIEILGASSDHLIVECAGEPLQVGGEVRFEPDYSALLRAMTSPFVAKVEVVTEVGALM